MDETIFLWVVMLTLLSGLETLAIIVAIKMAEEKIKERIRTRKICERKQEELIRNPEKNTSGNICENEGVTSPKEDCVMPLENTLL